MRLRISEARKNKRYKVPEVLDMLYRLRDLMFKVPEFYSNVVDGTPMKQEQLVDYFQDVYDIADLYQCLLKKTIRKLAAIRAGDDMSLLEYMIIHDVGVSTLALSPPRNVYRELQAMYNIGLVPAREVFSKIEEKNMSLEFGWICSPQYLEMKRLNPILLDQLTIWAKKYCYEPEKELKKIYKVMEDTEIVFWDALDGWNPEKYQLTDTLLLEFVSCTGERLATIKP